LHKYLKSAVLVLLVGLVTVWFGRRLDWAKIADELRQSDVKLIGVAAALVCLTYLVRAFRWRALLAPLVHTRATFHLGQALEASGDTAGACSAYASVLGRWGNARPLSVTANKARQRSRGLLCRTAAPPRRDG
jgi:hypothetical protein